MLFSYEVNLYEEAPYGGEKKILEMFKGTVEASDYLAAKRKSYAPIQVRVNAIRRDRGILVGMGDVRVKVSSDYQSGAVTMTPQEYQQCALRTVYPDLSTNERLGLCGLGLSGEVGEVTDLIKKFLYHRNGKPLDRDRLKDELGDALWYLFVLLDTVGLTFEDVIAANVVKLEGRHKNGFTPQYASDSHDSE
jgi:NTP pyrophosphatase (non-canonical NTP hydrolase)